MSVNPFDLHEFLSLSDKLVVISLLLGTSVAYCGTSNFYVSQIILLTYIIGVIDQQDDLCSLAVLASAHFV